MTRGGICALSLLIAAGGLACNSVSDLLERRDGGGGGPPTVGAAGAGGGAGAAGAAGGASVAGSGGGGGGGRGGSGGTCVAPGTGPTPQPAPLFDDPVTVTLPADTNANAVAIGDVTGDGLPDVVIGSGYAGSDVQAHLVVLPQEPSGALGAPIIYRVTNTAQTFITLLTLADLNGDQRLDVAVDVPSGVGILFQLPSGALGPVTELATTYPVAFIAVGDFNADGRTDLAASGADFWLQTSPGPLSAGQISVVVAGNDVLVQDVDGDGRDDLVSFQPPAGWIGLNLQLAAGSFGPLIPLLTGDFSTEGVALTDVDGDCRPDLVFGINNGIYSSVGVALQLPSGAFAAPTMVSTSPSPANLAVADVDGDGRADAVVLNSGWSAISVHRQVATGGLAAGESYPFARIDNTGPNTMAVGDINGDGLPDVLGVDGAQSILTIAYHHRP